MAFIYNPRNELYPKLDKNLCRASVWGDYRDSDRRILELQFEQVSPRHKKRPAPKGGPCSLRLPVGGMRYPMPHHSSGW